ncbi:MAG: alkaline phosphatase family protein [Lacipirellulaceae bacterium]
MTPPSHDPRPRHSVRSVGILPVIALLAAAGPGLTLAAGGAPADTERVGYIDGRGVTPVNQWVTPIGQQVDLPGLRPQAVALSPDGALLVTSGKTSDLVVLNAATGAELQRLTMPADSEPDEKILTGADHDGQLSYTGLVFSPDGKRLLLSNVGGTVKVFSVDAGRITPRGAWKLPAANAPRRANEVPAGIAYSADGSKVYVAGNLSNTLVELDATSGKVLRTFDVGVAPYDVIVVGAKAYVSNWGGRRPGEGDLTGPAGRGTTVRVDPVRHIASEGSVSVVDLTSGGVTKELIVGLHASGLAASPDGRHVVCCNAASDHLSVIDTTSDTVVATVWAKPNAADLLGAAPNAVVFAPNGARLYVANGSQNAVAVFAFDRTNPQESKLRGMFPVGWYPGALVLDAARDRLVVANIKGLAKQPKEHPGEDDQRAGARGFNSHHYHGSLSLVSLPKDDALPTLSERVATNLRAPRIAAALAKPRPDQPPRAILQRVGEPSLIEHVVYIIKENRTYDQVFGAHPRGDGDASLALYGPEVTPNHHKIADEFVLLDNTYCSGICSADGHQWTTTAYSTDYMEKSFAGFPRSYPDGMGIDEDDALAYSPAGFLWDNALAHGKTVRNYGEFMGPSVSWRDKTRKGEPGFLACYKAWKKGDWKNGGGEVVFACWPSVESLRAISPLETVGWNMSVPDQFRADYFLRDLARDEARGDFPNLTFVCLPQDHTSGTSPGTPTPAACMADNDLALGRILEGLSRSKFWPKTAVFVIEDDPQGGWDHVSGYRTIAFVAGPHVKRGAVVSTQYNTTSLIRTMEQILGLPPMNQFDASAEPMSDCFTDTPDTRPFEAAPSAVPLDQMNPDPQAIDDPQLRRDALVSASLNFRQVDRAPEDVLNRILWRALRGVQTPYPEWAITAGAEDDE